VNRANPVVNFLECHECTLEESEIPNCYDYGANPQFVRPPKIPIGVRIPIILDTGAEVSILNTKFVQSLFPGQDLSTNRCEVRNLGGGLVTIKGLIELTVEVCNLILKHPFYFYDGNPTFLMGFDLITRAALTTDAESRCVWSKHTLRCHIKQDLANTCAKPTIQVNADPFLETVPPSERAGCEDMSEYKCCEQELTPLSTASCTPEFFQTTAESRLPYTCRLQTRVSSTPESCTRVEAGVQASESFTFDSSDFSCQHTLALSTESLRTENSSELLSTSEQPYEINSNLDPFATVFVPEHSTLIDDSVYPSENLQAGTQAFVESPLENAVATCKNDQPLSIHVVKSLFEPLNFDDDVTLLKTKFDPGENSSKLDAMEIIEESGLSEHVRTLFTQIFEQSDFPVKAADGLKQLLFDHRDTFMSFSSDLGFCEILKLVTRDRYVNLLGKPPLAARDAEDEILNDMLDTGVIKPSNSSWASPVCLVRKKDGTFRYCIDYRRVNAVSKKDAYPIPDIQDALDNLWGAKYFATFDLLSGYWQLGLTERAKERSAFCTRRGLFQFTRMPFGLSGTPGSFCRLMSIVLRDLLWEICLEDSLVDLFGDEEHPSNVEPSLQPDTPLEETQDFDSQQLDETQLSQRPTCTRRLPTALEPYIVGSTEVVLPNKFPSC